MKYTTILIEKKNSVIKIILNRPQVMNAMNEEMLDELTIALRDAQQDNEVNVVIITGAGKAFSAGRDIKQIQQRREEQKGYFRPGGPVYGLLEQLDKPVIAAVNGFCYTGALEFMMCADYVIAADTAIFADTHARFGLVHGGGGIQRLSRLIGPKKAMEIMTICEPVTATEAERIGLINKVVPADRLEEAAMEMAAKIMKNNQISVRTIKSMVRISQRTDLSAGLELEAIAFRKHAESQEVSNGQERIKSFTEKKGV